MILNKNPQRYDFLSPKQFRYKIRNCLRTCIKYKYKIKVIDYYVNSLGGENISDYTGVITSFDLVRPNPEDNWWKLKLKFSDGYESEYEISNDILYVEDIRKIGNEVEIKWTTCGPYCSLTFKHVLI